MTVYEEKLLPHDLEAEEAVVGSIIIDGQCLTHVSPLLKAGDFYRDRNQILFDAAMALFQRDIAVDQTTLAGELQRTEKLDLVGGMAYLSHLVAITPTSVHAEDYAQAISRTSTMRRLIDAGNRIIDLGYADTEDIETTMRQAEDALFTVRGAGQPRGFVSLKEIYDQYLQEQASAAADPEFSGMPIMSGFPDLDECLGGLQRADLVILGARPSMGKSSLAVNMAVNAAKSGQTCGVFSLEMTREQLAMRILASEADIDSHRLRMGLYTHLEEARIIDSIGRLSDLPVFIDDTPYQGMVEMRGKARRLALERGLDLLVVDYLQLVQGQQRWGQTNRVQEITEISRELKVLAGDLKLALIACSQAEPDGREPAEQPPQALGPAGQRQHRAGRRRGDVHTPRGCLHDRGGVGNSSILGRNTHATSPRSSWPSTGRGPPAVCSSSSSTTWCASNPSGNHVPSQATRPPTGVGGLSFCGSREEPCTGGHSQVTTIVVVVRDKYIFITTTTIVVTSE